MLQCAAVCCSVLQGVAVCCSVLQCVAVCCSVLQCVAVCAIIDYKQIGMPFMKNLEIGIFILNKSEQNSSIFYYHE